MKHATILATALLFVAASAAAGTCTTQSCSEVVYQETFRPGNHSTPAVEVPPEDVEPVGPYSVPFVDPETVVLKGYHGDGDQYCIAVTSSDFPDLLSLVPPVCMGLSGLEDNLDDESIPLLPSDQVGPSPGIYEGDLWTIPEQSTDRFQVEVSVTMHWNPSLLHERASAGGVTVIEPVDPLRLNDVTWFQEHPDETGLTMTWTITDLDGNTMGEASGTQTIPYVGQVVAAALAGT